MTLPIEYVAGFIDGEGGFGIYPKSVRMTVSNAHRGVLVAVREVVGGGRIAVRDAGWGPLYELGVGSLLLREFLPRVIPHLVVKRRVAELVLEYLGPIPVRGDFRHHVAEAELRRRAHLRDRIRAINATSGRMAWETAEWPEPDDADDQLLLEVD